MIKNSAVMHHSQCNPHKVTPPADAFMAVFSLNHIRKSIGLMKNVIQGFLQIWIVKLKSLAYDSFGRNSYAS